MRTVFPSCGARLGFYPIVDNIDLLRQVLDGGASVVQLRIKDTSETALRTAVGDAMLACEEYGARLFVNDHWQLAMRYGAFGVHLGQEDLKLADLQQIHASGLRLGISTHSEQELANALTVWPSYIALGPVFPTQTKVMPWQPQGHTNLERWRSELDRNRQADEPPLPLVAIGGISLDRARALVPLADGIACISDIRDAAVPSERARAWTQLFRAPPPL